MTDKLLLDYTNCLAGSIGATHGLTESEMDTLIAKIPKHHENIVDLRDSQEGAWFSAPEDISVVEAKIKEHAGKWEFMVVLGIGGSIITPRSLLESLGHSEWNLLDSKTRKKAPRVLFIDNADPNSVSDALSVIDPKKTLFLVNCRSGITAEVAGLFLYLLEFAKKKTTKAALAKNFILCTDVEKSPLTAVAEKEKIQILPVQDGIGDRYGIFSNSTLFICGMCGLDVKGLVAGARTMEERCWHGDAWKNPAYMHALIHYLLTRKRRKTIHAMMGFSSRLAGPIDWYEHLLSVSLGKMLNRKGKAVHVGPTPANSIGPSGLHGQMQLYSEGPFDKVTTFITVDDHGSDLEFPNSHSGLDNVGYLGGTELKDIVDQSYITAAQLITEAGRPNMTIELDGINAESIGSLYFMLQLSTVMSAELYGIDPFNQPVIDSNKQGIFAQLGRSGFEDRAKILADYRSRDRKTC